MKLLFYYLKLVFIFLPRLSKELSQTFLGSAILLVELWCFLLTRKTMLRGKTRSFSFVYKDKNFTLDINSPIDIAALVEIFVLKEYRWDLKHSIKNILDLGAHWGDSSIFYAMEYPQARVFAVEPSPTAFSRLSGLGLQFPNIKFIQAAFSNHVGEDVLYVSSNSLGNSLSKRSHNDVKVSVKTYDQESLCALAEVTKFDLVKFDIEGGEKYLFDRNLINTFARSYIGEVHFDLMDMTKEEVEEAFTGFEVSFTKLSEKRYILRATR